MAQALKEAGFKGIQIPIMMAIAMAESGGNPASVGDGGLSYGLWQIYQPVWGSQFGVDCATNIKCAAKASWIISNHGTNFNPWTVYGVVVNPGNYPESLRANKFTNFLPDALAYVGLPVGYDWRKALSDLIGSGGNGGDNGSIDIPVLPGWADDLIQSLIADPAERAIKVPLLLAQCGTPDSIFDVGWASCVTQAITSPVGDIGGLGGGLFDALGIGIPDLKDAIVVTTLLGIGFVFLAVGAWGLANKSETFKEFRSSTIETAKTATKVAAVAA
jgi:hypothetical protein